MTIFRLLNLRTALICVVFLGLLALVPTDLASQTPVPTSKKESDLRPATASQIIEHETFDVFKRPSIITQAVTLSLLALLPFIIMVLTSFMKIVVVLSLLRSALGVQQAPPNQIINGVAFMLSLYIMYPTALKMYQVGQQAIDQATSADTLFSTDSSK